MRWAALLVLVAPAGAHAAGFAVAEQSPVAGGTAGAGTARSDDPALAWYNPAALADGGSFRAQVGVTFAMPSVDAADPGGAWAAETEPAFLTPPHIYLSYARFRHAGGISVNVPFGAGVTWPADWRGRHEIVASRLQVVRIAPFYAYGYLDWRLSAGVQVDLGSLNVARRLDFVDAEGDVDLALTGVGIGFHASWWWRFAAGLDVGFSYKSRSTVELDGDANFTAPDAFAYKLPDQGARAEVKLPDRLALGVHWRVAPRVHVIADAELFLWGTYDRLVIDFEEEQTPDVMNDTRWETTVALRAGAEVEVSSRATLRGGAFYDPSPAPDDTLAPTSPDSTRLGVTLGGGVAVTRNVTVDVFYEYLHLTERTYQGEEHLVATYGGAAHLFGVGVRWAR